MKKQIIFAAALTALMASAAIAQSPEGLTTIESKNAAPATIEKLETAIRAAGLKMFARIDHSGAAAEAGLAMPPAIVVIFGNPSTGTPNFLKAPTLAIDLPLKALIWQDGAGKVFVSYNSGGYVIGTLFKRHGLTPPEAAAAQQEKLLAGLAQQAAN